MAIRDLSSERLFVPDDLSEGQDIELSQAQAHYLANVLRMAVGAAVLVFNGRDGEWRAKLAGIRKRSATLRVEDRTRLQVSGPDIDYLFAPLKRSRLDYMVQKATEMGVARLRPVLTERTIAERVKAERMAANVIEAAEQCGVLRVPQVLEPQGLVQTIETWPAERRLIFCDEEATGDPMAALDRVEAGPLAVLIGPEGGFSQRERALLLSRPFVVSISLGPRVMRADTAAVAALALVNASIGDWRQR